MFDIGMQELIVIFAGNSLYLDHRNSRSLEKQLGLEHDKDTLITYVVHDSPAEKAGMKKGVLSLASYLAGTGLWPASRCFHHGLRS